MTKEEAIAVFECLATEMTAILAGIPKSEAAADQIKRYIDAYNIAISALRIQQKQENVQSVAALCIVKQTVGKSSQLVNGVVQKLHLPATCRMEMDVLIKSMETTTMSQ